VPKFDLGHRLTSPAQEDYLTALHGLRGDAKRVPTSEIAGELGINPASVSEMFGKLAALKLVTHDPYHGARLTPAGSAIAVEIVRKNPDQVGFAINPRRWVVERFFAWIGRNRRLAKDFEATIDSARAFLYAASIMLLVRRIARAS